MPKEPIYLFSCWTLPSVAVDLTAEPFVLRGNKGAIDLLAANSYLFPPPPVLYFVSFSGFLGGKVQSAWKQKAPLCYKGVHTAFVVSNARVHFPTQDPA